MDSDKSINESACSNEETIEQTDNQPTETSEPAPQAATAEDQNTEGVKKSKNPLDKIQVSLPVSVSTREELDEIVSTHQIWYESVLNPMKKIVGGRANLKGADLSGWDLSGLNLSGATLENVNLIGANLSKTNLTAANLKNADLQGATLKGTKLKRAILSHADFRDADLEDADLRDACTDYAKFDRKGAQAADISETTTEPTDESPAEDLTLETETIEANAPVDTPTTDDTEMPQ